jgi:hypothetical protein
MTFTSMYAVSAWCACDHERPLFLHLPHFQFHEIASLVLTLLLEEVRAYLQPVSSRYTDYATADVTK